MDTELAIRSVRAQDWAQWLPLWQGYNACRADAAAVPDEVTGMTWQRFFDACEPVHALVAEQGNQLVGLAHYLFHRSTYKLGPNCCLQDLFTAEAVRGQGVGRALIAVSASGPRRVARRVCTGRHARPIPPQCAYMTRWRRGQISSSIAAIWRRPSAMKARCSSARCTFQPNGASESE